VKPWWFNPHDGRVNAIGTFENKGEREFTPPDNDEMLDSVLVFDKAAKQYPTPGGKRLN
jgi:Putative collagen-binding domain of a collagenase